MDPTKRAQQLLEEGYYQTSRGHRRVARLPPGKTGRQALREVAPRMAELSEASAGDHYLRCYCREHLDLDQETFNEFRRLGGTTYHGRGVPLELDEQLRNALYDLNVFRERCRVLEAQAATVAERDVAWVLAMTEALGADSGYTIPVVPDAQAFRNLFALLRLAS